VCEESISEEYDEHVLRIDGDSFVYTECWNIAGTSVLIAQATDMNGGNTFIISEETETIHHIDQKFIPDTIARVSDVEAAQSAANAYTDKKVAEGGGGGVPIPVVEITTASNPETGTTSTLNEADSTALHAAFDSVIDSGTPVKIILPQTSKIKIVSFATPSGVSNNGTFVYKFLCFTTNKGLQILQYTGGDYWEVV
jgi:hypothetical protein